MKTILILFALFSAKITLAQDNNLFANQSAAGARAGMGIFAYPFYSGLSNDVFDFPYYSWQNASSSLGLSVIGYQLLSYDRDKGVVFEPHKFNKQWPDYLLGMGAGIGLDWYMGVTERSKDVYRLNMSVFGIAAGSVIIVGLGTGGWRMADEGKFGLQQLFTNRHSYWIHFTGSAGLYWSISNHSISQERALLYTMGLVWAWEVKDGFLRWESIGHIGGDGFSYRDGTAGSIAVLGSYLADKYIITPLGGRSRNKSFNVSLVPNGAQFAYYF